MTELHKKIVNEIVEEQKKNSNVIAINLFGIVADGKERPDSDVDIEIIINEGKEWKWFKQNKYGIHIDFVRCSRNHLLHQIEEYPYLCHIYLDKKVIYDIEGFMVEVKKRLNLIWINIQKL
jgi:predicted nucleotidyltransferase